MDYTTARQKARNPLTFKRLQNRPFCRLKQAVLQAEKHRFAAQNGAFCKAVMDETAFSPGTARQRPARRAASRRFSSARSARLIDGDGTLHRRTTSSPPQV